MKTKRAAPLRAVEALPPNTAEPEPGSRLRYQLIHDQLKSAIARGRIKPGLVMLEGPVARLFGTSRVPVRKAFEMLHAGGLLHTFDGRGYLVAHPDGRAPEPVRAPLSETALGLDEPLAPLDIPSNGERIYDALKAVVSLGVVFGHFRIDESLAAAHFGVSRGGIREALTRLRDVGLVEKSAYSHWLCGPLTARAVAQDYELRALLEPAALLTSAPQLPRAEIEAALTSLDHALADLDGVDVAALYRLETDLHRDGLRYAPNPKLRAAITGAHMPLTVNHAFYAAFNLHPDRATLIEHRAVWAALLSADAPGARAALAAHLASGQKRTLQRLKALAVLPEPELPGYMQRLA